MMVAERIPVSCIFLCHYGLILIVPSGACDSHLGIGFLTAIVDIVTFLLTGNNIKYNGRGSYVPIENKTHQWFGATVASSATNGVIVVSLCSLHFKSYNSWNFPINAPKNQVQIVYEILYGDIRGYSTVRTCCTFTEILHGKSTIRRKIICPYFYGERGILSTSTE